MSRATSIFLDFLRVVAAGAVFLTHCSQNWSDRFFQVMKHVGHDAVIVFFVLSGYVIAYSVLRKAGDGRSYALARLARLYSVVLPALLLTGGLQFLGTAVNPEYYGGIARAYEGARVLLAAFFLQEAWMFSASPGTNPPLWSLGYEFWYYALFGAALFLRTWRSKLAGLALLALLVGPKVLLLFPIWLLGAAVYLLRQRLTLPPARARAAFALAGAGFTAAVLWLPDYPVPHGFAPLFYSGAFLSDFVKALLLAGAIWAFEAGCSAVDIPVPVERAVRGLADRTFSLYVYHFPLIVFATAVVPFDHGDPWQVAGMMAAVLAVVFGLSAITEAQRPAWRRGLAAIWDGCTQGGRGGAAP